ncbi:MAG: hypothetical protein FWG64_00310 [Firmicutes bacterium]|nr:hypothetical protein [Bacillota bacterium]
MEQAIEAYRGITVDEEFRYLEILRARAKHDEAQALHNAELKGERRGEERADQKWQVVVSEKDSALKEKDILIADLLSQLNKKQ